MKSLERTGGLFVTVMPRTWEEDKVFREKVVSQGVKWKRILTKENNRNPKIKLDVYKMAVGQYETKNGYRLVWVHSSQKAEQDMQSREGRLLKASESIEGMKLKSGKYKLKSEKAINEKVDKALEQYKVLGLIDYTVTKSKEKITKRSKVGRPRAGDKKQYAWKENFSLQWKLNEEVIGNQEKLDGIFPLLTNVKDKSEKELLSIYKHQAFIEKKNSQLKTWQRVSSVLLKSSKRVVAYVHMHIIALTVASLIERTLRRAIEKKNIKDLNIYPEKRNCPYPTYYDVERLFRSVEKYEMNKGDEAYYFPAELTPEQKKVLKLLGVPLSFYQ